MSFSNDIKKWAEKTNQDIHDVRRAAFFEMSSAIIKRTPVDTGRMKGNWQATLNAEATGSLNIPFGGSVKGVSDDSAGRYVLNGVTRAANNAKGDESMYLTNNLSYAVPLEYGHYGSGPNTTGGYSNQAPTGMVRITVREYQMHVKNAVNSL
jgi:hypothetical protein